MLIGKLFRNLLFSKKSFGMPSRISALLDDAGRLEAEGDVDGAIGKCQQAFRLSGGEVPALVCEGGILARTGRYAEGQVILEAALARDPNHPQALFLLGTTYLVQRQFAQAATCLDKALLQIQTNAAVFANRGQAALGMGDVESAIHSFRRALELEPNFSAAVEPLYTLLIQQEAYDDAMALVNQLIARDRDNGRWWRMKGFLLFKRYYEPERAEACYAKAEAAGEGNAAFWIERGICARDLARTTFALDCIGKALCLEPGNPLARFHRGLTNLYLGNYESAWDDYEARFADSALKNITLPAPRWDGGPLVGRELILVAEQGLGDEIMFSSCFNDLPRDGKVLATCSEKLIPIYRASFPWITILSKESPVPSPEAGKSRVAIAIGSLPALYRRHDTDFPRRPYLSVPDDARARMATQEILSSRKPKIGISWRGGTEASRLRLRSLDLKILAEVLKVPGIEWISLQYGDCADDIRCLSEQYGISIHHDATLLADYSSTAALVERLDRVVTVCTAIVHLAGALGKEVWVLAPQVPEWRYGLHAPHMPWYPSVEVLRQEKRGDWSVPITEIKKRLALDLLEKQCPSEEGH